jgi:hypothetical protein
MKKPAWSHSALKDFEGCQRRYHEVKVLKKYPFVQGEAAKYGEDLHKALEDYVRDGTPIPEKFEFAKPVVDVLAKKPGRKLVEHKMALTTAMQPCDWFDRAVWVRGMADLLIVDDDNFLAWVVDYKTGNNKYPERDQLTLMSLMVFEHFPHVRKVNSALIYVVKNDMVKQTMTRDEKDDHWWKFRERVAKLEACYANDVWNPRPTPLCGWCPCTGCEHHPKH